MGWGHDVKTRNKTYKNEEEEEIKKTKYFQRWWIVKNKNSMKVSLERKNNEEVKQSLSVAIIKRKTNKDEEDLHGHKLGKLKSTT